MWLSHDGIWRESDAGSRITRVCIIGVARVSNSTGISGSSCGCSSCSSCRRGSVASWVIVGGGCRVDAEHELVVELLTSLNERRIIWISKNTELSELWQVLLDRSVLEGKCDILFRVEDCEFFKDTECSLNIAYSTRYQEILVRVRLYTVKGLLLYEIFKKSSYVYLVDLNDGR